MRGGSSLTAFQTSGCACGCGGVACSAVSSDGTARRFRALIESIAFRRAIVRTHRAEIRLLAQLRVGPERGDEGLLEDVVGIGRADEGHHEAMNRALVVVEEDLEGAVMTLHVLKRGWSRKRELALPLQEKGRTPFLAGGRAEAWFRGGSPTRHKRGRGPLMHSAMHETAPSPSMHRARKGTDPFLAAAARKRGFGRSPRE